MTGEVSKESQKNNKTFQKKLYLCSIEYTKLTISIED